MFLPLHIFKLGICKLPWKSNEQVNKKHSKNSCTILEKWNFLKIFRLIILFF